MPHPPLRRRLIPPTSSGFTLLEVMVALVIVGIVGMLSAGKFHAIGIQAKVARSAQSVRSDLEFAFTLAARNRQPVRVSWDGTKMQMDVTDRAGTTYFRRTPLGKDYGLSGSNVTFKTSPIEIYPNGLANNVDTIWITLEATSRTITMSRGGMVRVQ